jgi:hypothetical protein
VSDYANAIHWTLLAADCLLVLLAVALPVGIIYWFTRRSGGD